VELGGVLAKGADRGKNVLLHRLKRHFACEAVCKTRV
jgi:hypothetical protein